MEENKSSKPKPRNLAEYLIRSVVVRQKNRDVEMTRLREKMERFQNAIINYMNEPDFDRDFFKCEAKGCDMIENGGSMSACSWCENMYCKDHIFQVNKRIVMCADCIAMNNKCALCNTDIYVNRKCTNCSLNMCLNCCSSDSTLCKECELKQKSDDIEVIQWKKRVPRSRDDTKLDRRNRMDRLAEIAEKNEPKERDIEWAEKEEEN